MQRSCDVSVKSLCVIDDELRERRCQGEYQGGYRSGVVKKLALSPAPACFTMVYEEATVQIHVHGKKTYQVHECI